MSFVNLGHEGCDGPHAEVTRSWRRHDGTMTQACRKGDMLLHPDLPQSAQTSRRPHALETSAPGTALTFQPLEPTMRAALLLPLTSLALAAQTPVSSSAADRRSVSLTLYQGNLSLVRETRAFKAPEGPFRLRIEGLPRQAQEESLRVESRPDAARLAFASRSFLSGYPDPQKVLDAFIGEKVKVATSRDNGETVEEGTLIASTPQLLVQFPDRVEALPGTGRRRLILPGLPAGLPVKPVVELLGSAPSPGDTELSVDYLCQGLRWRCDYSATLDRDSAFLDLSAWATLVNLTHAEFKDVPVQLFSGDIPGAEVELLYARLKAPAAGFSSLTQSARSDPWSSAGVTGGHAIYSLPEPVTLLANQTVQVSLLTSHRVPVRKVYEVTWPAASDDSEAEEEGGREIPVEMLLETRNDRDHQLGRPLPGGAIRLFQPDGKGLHQFIGTPPFPETATDEKLRLSLGASPEFTTRARTLNEKITPIPNTKLSVTEASRELFLTNRQDTEQTVRVLVPLAGSWQVLQTSRPWKKENAHLLAFDVPVPARGKATLTFQVRVKA